MSTESNVDILNEVITEVIAESTENAGTPEICTEVPYSQRCEFCGTQSGIAILHAENQVAPTFSVRVCAGCFGKLIRGDQVPDIFGWSWSISSDGVVTAETDWTLTLSWDYREECAETLGVTQPQPTQEDDGETRDLIRDLGKALRDYHLGLHTTRSLARTYGRDESLLYRVTNWLGEDIARGSP